LSGNWDRFTDTFFNAKVMLKYLPDILSGVVVTIELALLIVVTGIAAGLALALLRSLAIRPLNWLIIFWAGIISVAKGQWEAARSTGLSFGQTLMSVVLPQALRLTIPPLTNRTIAITKGTALGTVVAVTEILGQASSAMSNSYNPSPLMMGAAAYVVLFFPVVVAGRWVETKFAWKR
jgi:polar amino acid transport system permease protein